jgi:hypothetical protein
MTRILQVPSHFGLVTVGKLLTEQIHGFPQRPSPALIPAGVSARIAAAVTSPALDAVHTAPGAVFNYLNFMDGRMQFQIFTVVGKTCQA